MNKENSDPSHEIKEIKEEIEEDIRLKENKIFEEDNKIIVEEDTYTGPTSESKKITLLICVILIIIILILAFMFS